MENRRSLMIAFLLSVALLQAPNSRAQFPTITNQPASQVVWAGGNVMFAVGVSNAGLFAYQWQFNSTNLPNNIITTVVGGGLSYPSGLAVDAFGNLFIADNGYNCIFKLSTNGIITTFAGNRLATYSGDGGAATNASLSGPFGLAIDHSGNLFFADSANGRIRKVSTNGIITTVAGGGANNPGDGGAATNSSLSSPFGVAVDSSNNLFFADTSHNRIRKVNINGIITTVAGNGYVNTFTGYGGYSGDGGSATSAELNWPQDVTVDTFGNLYIADSVNFRVRKVFTNGVIMTVAGNGTFGYSGDGSAATNAKIGPYGVAVDSSGNQFIVDNADNRIRQVNTNGIITTAAGDGPNYPLTGSYSGDGGAATNAGLYEPLAATLDPSGDLFIADTRNQRIRKVISTQGSALTLNNVSAANVGNYQVVVTGPGGSITSSVANLVVATSSLIYQTMLNSDGTISLGFICQPGSTNVVLCATNLMPPVLWQALSTNLAGADGTWRFIDTNAVNYQTRFYRSLTQ